MHRIYNAEGEPISHARDTLQTWDSRNGETYVTWQKNPREIDMLVRLRYGPDRIRCHAISPGFPSDNQDLGCFRASDKASGQAAMLPAWIVLD